MRIYPGEKVSTTQGVGVVQELGLSNQRAYATVQMSNGDVVTVWGGEFLKVLPSWSNR